MPIIDATIGPGSTGRPLPSRPRLDGQARSVGSQAGSDCAKLGADRRGRPLDLHRGGARGLDLGLPGLAAPRR